MIGSIFTCLGHYIGVFPIGLKLSCSCLSSVFENLPKDQRSTFEAPRLCLAVVVSGCLLLIVGHLDRCGLSYFVCPVQISSSASVRIVGSPISVGMIASIPYARAKGVFPVGRPGVVR